MAPSRGLAEGGAAVSLNPSWDVVAGDLLTRLRAHLRAEPYLVPRGSRVIVALSGGPDSTALLLLLSGLGSDLELDLEVAHFDHRVRSGAAQEISHARRLAADLGFRFHAGAPPAPPDRNQASLREARYRWLCGIVEARRADRLAVGHQADDQAETVLFRIMRGTDIRGLAGIPARRGPIVRPLLPFRREQLRQYLVASGVPWIEDPSNSDGRWARVRVRTEILPGLETAVPGAVDRLLVLGRAAARAHALSEAAAGRLVFAAALEPVRPGKVEMDRRELARAGPELQALALRALAGTAGVELTSGGTRAGVEFISEGRSGGRVMIGGGLQVSREYDRVILSRVAASLPPEELVVREGSGSGKARIGGRTLLVRWGPAGDGRQGSQRIAVAVPPGHYPLTFRGWRHGDRIRLPAGTRKLKKLFADRRVPMSHRASIPVLADRQGHILWIEGLATAATDLDPEHLDSLLELELRNE